MFKSLSSDKKGSPVIKKKFGAQIKKGHSTKKVLLLDKKGSPVIQKKRYGLSGRLLSRRRARPALPNPGRCCRRRRGSWNPSGCFAVAARREKRKLADVRVMSWKKKIVLHRSQRARLRRLGARCQERRRRHPPALLVGLQRPAAGLLAATTRLQGGACARFYFYLSLKNK